MGLIEDYIRANILAGEDGNFNDRFIAYLARNFIGSGDPEGVVAAPVASVFWRTDGGASTVLYVKESGTGNTGWVAYGAGGGGGGFTQEQIEDMIGAMVTGNTETGIAVTYDDPTSKLNFVAEVTQAELDAVAAAAALDLDNHEAAADPHTGYQKESEKGAANGYASLDGTGVVPDAQIPAAIARDSEVTTAVTNHEAAADPHTGYLKESLVDAKGDILTATAADTPSRHAAGTDGQIVIFDSSQADGLKNVSAERTITIVLDGGGSVLTTGVKKVYTTVPFDCTITRNQLLVDPSGSIVVDIWKDTYANFPPTVADTITASAKPTVTTATKSEDTTLTGWTVNLSKGDILECNIDSVTSVTKAILTLFVKPR